MKTQLHFKNSKHTYKPPPHNRYEDKENYKLLCQKAGSNTTHGNCFAGLAWYDTHKVNWSSQICGTIRGWLTQKRDNVGFCPLSVSLGKAARLGPQQTYLPYWRSEPGTLRAHPQTAAPTAGNCQTRRIPNLPWADEGPPVPLRSMLTLGNSVLNSLCTQ